MRNCSAFLWPACIGKRYFKSTGTSNKQHAQKICTGWVKAAELASQKNLTPDRARKLIDAKVTDVSTSPLRINPATCSTVKGPSLLSLNQMKMVMASFCLAVCIRLRHGLEFSAILFAKYARNSSSFTSSARPCLMSAVNA